MVTKEQKKAMKAVSLSLLKIVNSKEDFIMNNNNKMKESKPWFYSCAKCGRREHAGYAPDGYLGGGCKDGKPHLWIREPEFY